MDDTAATPPRLTWRKAVVNLVGFGVGLALFVWVVRRATADGDWTRLRDTSPWLVAALLGSTMVSVVTNGLCFWVTALPLKNLGIGRMQRLNAVANMLNYAPLRLGALARVVYHVRVDGLGVLQVGAWFSMIGYLLFAGIGAMLVASLVRDQLDVIWLLLVIGQLAVVGGMTQAVAGQRIVRSLARGLEDLARDGRAVYGSMGVRLIDLMAYVARMGIAAAILGLNMPARHVVLLAMVALVGSLVPFGRLGFREACVAMAASRLNLASSDVEATWAQLALIDSMGEALVYVPLGACFMLWFRRSLIRGRGE